MNTEEVKALESIIQAAVARYDLDTVAPKDTLDSYKAKFDGKRIVDATGRDLGTIQIVVNDGDMVDAVWGGCRFSVSRLQGILDAAGLTVVDA